MTVKMGYMLQKEERRMGGDNVSQDQTSIICIDLKSFYASVECVERGLDPFKANLVVADPTRSKSTICLAITPAMKALGIKNRCRIHSKDRIHKATERIIEEQKEQSKDS